MKLNDGYFPPRVKVENGRYNIRKGNQMLLILLIARINVEELEAIHSSSELPNPSYAHDHMVLLESDEFLFVHLSSNINDVCFHRKIGKSIHEWV